MGGGTTNQTTTTKNKSNTSTTGTSSGSGTATGATTGMQDVSLPPWLQGLVTGLPDMTQEQLGGLYGDVSGFQIDPRAMEAVGGTAAGDYLYGGQAMDAFTQAAQRAALPGINSAFGQAGRGGSGLYNTAIGQAGIDAYANLYNQERGRQLEAAQLLPQFQQLPINLKNMLLQQTLSVPQAFSSLFGQRTAGTSDLDTTQQQEFQSRVKEKGSGSQITPVNQPGPLEYGLAGLGLLGSFV